MIPHRARFRTRLLLAAIVAGAGVSVGAPAPAPESPDGTLRATVALVREDLSVVPVPKKWFTIVSEDDPDRSYEVVTSFSGEVTIALPPGRYVLRSSDPITLGGRRFRWSVPFVVASGETTLLELSNDNAEVQEVSPTANPAVPLSEGELYRRYKASVFKILSEFGHGSGFLVDPRGLVLTNHHVVAQSDYLAVQLDDRRKYPAALVAADEVNDIAVLRVNPEVAEGIAPLQLAEDDPASPPVSVGERIVALGSPLTAENILTSGIVSKIEEGAIYSDVRINPGNSGGPMFAMTGEVIGMNTFGLQRGGGPGVAGTVRIHLALPLIEQARSELEASPPPPAKRLPVASQYRFPPDELRKWALSMEWRPKQYHVEAGKMDVQFITPVVVAHLEVKAEREAAEFRERRTRRKRRPVKEYKPGQDFYEWRQYAGDYKPVVRIQVVPEIKMTAGSAFALIMLGPVRYRFKTDFDRMELLRGNAVVEPIWPGRLPLVVDTQAGLVSMQDITYYGIYEYPPEAFRPDKPVVLRIWEQGKDEPVVRALDPEFQYRIWSHYEPYFKSLESHVAE